jgi:hypothetical protein
MNDLHPVEGRHTPTSAATQLAVAVEGDSRPRRETMTRMQREVMAVHRSALRQVEDVLVSRAGRACVDILCTHSIGVSGLGVAWSATLQHGVWDHYEA